MSRASFSAPLLTLLVLLGTTVAPTWGQSSEAKKLTPKDAERLRRVGSTRLSPDGAWISYTDSTGSRRGRRRGGGNTSVRAASDRPENASRLVLRQLDGDEKLQIKNGRSLSFSRDSQWAGWSEPRPRPEKEAAKPGKESEETRQTIPERLRAWRARGGERPRPQSNPGGGARRRWEGRRTRSSRRGRGGERTRRGRPGSGTPATEDKKPEEPKGRGDTLVLRNLHDSRSFRIKDVSRWRFTKDGKHLLYVHTPKEKAAHGIFLLDLSSDITAPKPRVIARGEASYRNVAFDEDGRYLTFWSDRPMSDAAEPARAAPRAEAPSAETKSERPVPVKSGGEPSEAATEGPQGESTKKKEDAPAKPKEPTRLWQWDAQTESLAMVYGDGAKGFPTDKQLVTGTVSWTEDRKSIFVRLRPKPEEGAETESGAEEEGEREITLPNGRTIRVSAAQAARFAARSSGSGSGPRFENDTSEEKKRDEARLDVWHWKDAKIATMKNRRGRGRRGGAEGADTPLLHRVDLDSGDVLLVGHERLSPSLNKKRTWGVAADDDPYAAARTWDRSYSDYYVVDLNHGNRRRVLTRSPRRPSWTPCGAALLVFDEEHRAWFAMAPETGERVRLDTGAARLGDDSRGLPNSGSFGKALPGQRALVWDDGKDLWSVPLDGSPSRNLTRTGRRDGISYKHLILDEDHPFGADDRSMLLTSTHDRTKAQGLHTLDLQTLAVTTHACLDKSIGRPVKAKDADRYAFTLTSAQRPADIWMADGDLGSMKRITDANPWLAEYELPTSEIVEWRSLDGEQLQGILMKPVGYQPGKTYPTIVYMYEILSNGLHRFRTPGLQLNPQTWAQNGYAVFMPDITYQIGRPGMSSVRCVVPGVQKLIEMGVADPDRVGLCGHSWGGYETAYIITQTKIFAAAVSGAPVVNMTSAYSGIRWSSGLPRQFQYERTQSRIGGSLWEYPERYIENSPVFHLENVETPVLIMFGNRDGAVPWYQGIEYFLGMRRLGKQAVFLEYKDEDHGLRRKPNQEDYHERIMAWWDHHLKGVEPADWIVGPTKVEPLGDTAPAIPAVNGN